MRASASRLLPYHHYRHWALSRHQRHPRIVPFDTPSAREQQAVINLGAETSLRIYHTTSSSSKIGRPQWLKRGMRGRLRAWADSVGLTAGQENAAPTDEPVGEELYVMPGWAVAKLRDTSRDGVAPCNEGMGQSFAE